MLLFIVGDLAQLVDGDARRHRRRQIRATRKCAHMAAGLDHEIAARHLYSVAAPALARGQGTTRVPLGTYDIYVSRGPEWDLAHLHDIKVAGPTRIA